MSIRCAVCGSKRVATEIKKEGYNQKKGIIGTALFGFVGAVAGTSGNEVTYYHCADCGNMVNHSLNEVIVKEIEFALENKMYSGYAEKLNKLKEKYPNIEWTKEEQKQAEKQLRFEKYTCDEDVIKEFEKYLHTKGILSHEEMKKYMLSLGYKNNIVDDIPFKIAVSDQMGKYNVRLLNKDGILYYEFFTEREVNGEKLKDINYEIYCLFFKDRLKELDDFQNKQEDLSTKILKVISKYPAGISMKDIHERELFTYSFAEVSYIIGQLKMSKKIERITVNGQILYKLLGNIENYKNSSDIETIKLENLADEEIDKIIEDEILNLLSDGSKKTIAAMQNQSGILKGQKEIRVVRILARLIENGKLTKVVEIRDTYYSINK